MVCYICQLGASLECRSCHRWVCSKHEVGVRICATCAEVADRIRAQQEQERQEKLAEARWCDHCQAESPDGWITVHKCAKCRRQFCQLHGQSVWITGGPYEDGWVRCMDHLEFAGVRGFQKRRDRLKGLHGCWMLPVGYTGTIGIIMTLLARKPDYFARTRYEEHGRSRTVYEFRGYDWMGGYKAGSRVLGIGE